MLRAETTIKNLSIRRKLASFLTASTKSAPLLLAACALNGILILVAANDIWPVWVVFPISALVILTALYLSYPLPANSPETKPRLTTLRDTSEVFRVAFDYSAIGMALVFQTGRWHRVNRSLCELLGYSESELLSREFQDLVHPDDRLTSMSKLEQLLRGKLATYQIEMRCIHRNGSAVWVMWSVSQALMEKSRSVHLIYQLQSITDRKVAEERLLHDAL